MRLYKGLFREAPLSEQCKVHDETEMWSGPSLWRSTDTYSVPNDCWDDEAMRPSHDPSYGPLMPHHIRACVKTFPNGTATGADNRSIRAYDALDDRVLLQLCMIYTACEKAGI